MKVSTKGRYGLRALVDMALHQGQSPMTLPEIAGRLDSWRSQTA